MRFCCFNSCCVAAGLAMTSPTQLHFSLSGLTESGTAFFIVAIALGYSRLANGGSRETTSAFAFGLVIGGAFLQRYNLVFVGAVACGLLLIGPQRSGIRLQVFRSADA